jgi:hypothetical protein
MSILLGLHIKRTLENNAKVKSFVGNRIFPLAYPQGVDTFPFICYNMNGQQGAKTKDGPVNDTASVSLEVVSKNYEEALNLANLVRYAFENKGEKYTEFEAENVGVTYNDEYVEDLDAYRVNMILDFKTKDV